MSATDQVTAKGPATDARPALRVAAVVLVAAGVGLVAGLAIGSATKTPSRAGASVALAPASSFAPGAVARVPALNPPTRLPDLRRGQSNARTSTATVPGGTAVTTQPTSPVVSTPPATTPSSGSGSGATRSTPSSSRGGALHEESGGGA